MTRNDRRTVLKAGIGLAAAPLFPAWAKPVSEGAGRLLSGPEIALSIGHLTFPVDGRRAHGIGINGFVPGPLIRMRQGEDAVIHVRNDLAEDSSIHWHGLLLPFEMDGVPGISFPGIRAGETFTYRFPLIQSGTYWYHSHSGLQEQMGHYGPLIIDPDGPPRYPSDREHVILLSDHSPLHPHAIMRRLKLQGGYFNFQKQTLSGLVAGRDQAAGERLRWGKMRMDPTDISDVTGSTYTYLMNGHGPADGWTGLFEAGERVRLRIINASAMTSFNFRIPGLPLMVVQADGQDVRPVDTDELQIAVAETYDLIVAPGDRAYSIVAESIDRSGMARGTLAPRPGMAADAPPLRPRPLATMKDMGMGGMHAGMKHGMREMDRAPAVRDTPAVQTISPMPEDRSGDRGQGLSDVGHRVLVYRDLVAAERNPDARPPSRTMEIHLTGNMERYMWAFDGVKLNAVKEPIPFRAGERVRVTLVNDTMMGHPIHLHGHFFELVTGHGDHAPRKHTVMVQPGGSISLDLTADAIGDWAFHCHLLYHMHAGMMQVVTVRPETEA